MNVMQSLADFKQNLHGSAHPAAPAAGSPKGMQATPAASTSSDSGSGSTTITANDFLQLLVAEMKNQDPTADQDPNAYIDQLVQVNSLQQLIAINQDLNPTGSSTSGSASGASVAGGVGAASAATQHRPTLGSAAGSPAASVATALVSRPPTSEPARVDAPGGGRPPEEPLGIAPHRFGPRTENPALPPAVPLR